jgi:hypothetical protein
MPYIKREDRQQLDPILEKIKEGKDGSYNAQQKAMWLEGTIKEILNLVVHKLRQGGRFNYQNLNETVGVLECVRREFLRIVGVPSKVDIEFDASIKLHKHLNVPSLGFLVADLDHPGKLNYCITWLMHQQVAESDNKDREKQWAYRALNEASFWFYNTIVAPYEDIKIQENGDMGILQKE